MRKKVAELLVEWWPDDLPRGPKRENGSQDLEPCLAVRMTPNISLDGDGPTHLMGKGTNMQGRSAILRHVGEALQEAFDSYDAEDCPMKARKLRNSDEVVITIRRIRKPKKLRGTR